MWDGSPFSGTKIALLCGGDVLAYLRDDKPGIPFPGMWDLPGGGREGDEDPVSCALREVEEEFGIAIGSDRVRSLKRYSSPSPTGLDTYFCVAEVAESEIASIRFGDEGQHWELMSVAEFVALEGAIPDMKQRLTQSVISDEATRQFYASEAQAYAASGPGGASRHLDGFLSLLMPDAHVLELGCGSGRDSAAMIARGFQVDVTDGVPEMAQEAASRLGRPVRVMQFDELEAIQTYDAIWAHAALVHVPRSALLPIIERIFRALKPGGLHFANFKTGRSEGRDTYGRYFNYLSAIEVSDVYARSGPWEIISIVEYDGGSYGGIPAPWVAINAKKPI